LNIFKVAISTQPFEVKSPACTCSFWRSIQVSSARLGRLWSRN